MLATKRYNRRAADRFPLEREARFTVLDTRAISQVGKCRTVNMSSRAILFRSEARLTEGKRLELAVSWPALLNDTCPLKLVALGRVIRSNSPYVDGQTVTLFDVDVDALLKDEEAFARLQNARTPAETAEALKNVQGVKITPERDIVIEFAP